MSAADPANPTPPTPPGAGDGAAVINISRRHSAHTTRGRWQPVTNPGHPQADEPAGDDTQALLADHFEKTFNQQNLTLSDDDTAETFRTTLTIVRGILHSAENRNILTEGQRRDLDALIEGMMSAPGLV